MKRVFFLFTFLCLIAGVAAAKGVTTNYRSALIFAYSPVNSVYEDDNIKLEIYNEQLYATNKTKKTIFIDLSQCFLVNNGSSYPMWSRQQNEKQASKAGLAVDEYLTIAPATGTKQNETFICNMSMRIYGKYSSAESPSEDFSEYDKRLLNIVGELATESLNADPKGKQYLGTVTRHLTEDESVNNIGASIAYAFNKKSENWTSVAISTWVSDIIFAPYYVEMPKELSKKEKKGFGVKETSPATIHVKAVSPFEFDEDKSPIIVCDWVGNFKKGTFELKSTRISKVKMPGFWANFFTLGYATAIAAVTNNISEVTYKSIIQFDGTDSDWGKMVYTGKITDTKRSE